jgi:threonine aldolase
MGGSAANAGVQFTAVGEKGLFTAEDFIAAVKPRGHIIYPPTTLVEIENTHNRAGGVVFPQHEAIFAQQLPTCIKRIWTARALERRRRICRSLAQLAAPFDLVSVALSKGLGAPGGSLLAGSKEIIQRCVRHRRMLGGAMRQVGIFAAAGLYALDHNVERLAQDHANARLIAERLATNRKFVIDLATVQTNILVRPPPTLLTRQPS